jgi:polyisoprenyl-teichoic acid--peptidoglycan teichoic acid transferase
MRSRPYPWPVTDPTEPTSPITDAELRPAPPPRQPSAARLLILAAIFPGLPHLLRGRRGWAALLALPVIVPILAVAVLVLATSKTAVAARLLDPSVLSALIVVQVLLVVWRLAAIGAVRVLAPIRARATTVAALLVAVALVVGPQALAVGLTSDARDAAAAVFQPVGEGGAWVPDATAPPVASNDPDFAGASPSLTASEAPSAVASASPTPGVPRINVLLIGVDAGVGRNTFATDTMIVASLDPVAGTVSMASVPRDMVDVPLPDGRIFRPKLNSLVSYFNWNKSKFPGAKDGESVLASAIGTLLGIKIDLWAEVNLGGFAALVDSVGGINIRVTTAFCDYRYKEYGIDGFQISPGWWHMNGDQALAYARVRKAPGESDFTRAARQQEVIAAIRDRVVRGGFLSNPTKFLQSAGQTVRTNISPAFIAEWVDTATKVGRNDVYRIVIGHPYVKAGFDDRGSIQIPDIPMIRDMAAKLFTPAGTRPTGFDTMPSNGSGATTQASSSSTCGRTPAPTVLPTPTAQSSAVPSTSGGPTASESPSPSGSAAPTATPAGTTPSPAPTVSVAPASTSAGVTSSPAGRTPSPAVANSSAAP